jgi:transcription-repair coupling factor (superfamily II helicase)
MTQEPADAARLLDEVPLFSTSPGLRVRQLPDWETLPYDSFSPHQDLISERLETLHALQQGQLDVLLVPVSTAAHRLAPPAFLAAHTFFFRQGDVLDAGALRRQLALAQYESVGQVTRPGEFSQRGGLLDLFPMGSALPYRIDLFDDTIESIRAFDVDTQRSLYPVREVKLLPGREFPFDETARNAFRSRFREQFEGDPSKAGPYRDVGSGIAFAGVEYYLPLFFEATATLFDYLPEHTVLVTLGDPEAALQRFLSDARSRWEFLKSDRERPILPPDQVFLEPEEFFIRAKASARLALTSNPDTAHPVFAPPPSVALQRKLDDPARALRALMARSDAPRLVIAADSAGRRETIEQVLRDHGLNPAELASINESLDQGPPLGVCVAPLTSGFAWPEQGVVLLTESDLYEGHVARRGKRGQERTSSIDAMIRDLAELREGDPVVHTQHGIGRYQGLITLDGDEGPNEFLKLEYAQGATLYVPVSQLHVIARYSGADPEQAPLHALGSGAWEKARRKAAQKARDTAAELLNLYARRAAREGHRFKLPISDYQAFAEAFGFEETPDQAAAIAAVLTDMSSGRPMDRLVCGDVGFGKTEVALRAAFMAVANGKQVALLCPTTLLAEQHAQNFTDRFADWPVKVVELSRFRSAKEVKAAIEGIKAGSVDIVIGTHKLLSDSVQFKDLGLVIIDEEHRFGVRQKEALKALRAEVDVLTLTATPIPRTLGMSLEGIRDFSVIATAPQKRLAIKTFVRSESEGTLREAILRELKRGGQVYFLHNEVDTIHNRRARLEVLVPEARIGVAHGQMPERELEQVMKGFYHQRFNLLLCTTIIETGIDVPTANTIIIHRADRFGLAQLHQLRGRVGRSHHQAYAYLLIPGEEAITSNARKRLEAIQSMEELGSGFYLAMHDMEIRGAGEVLGDAQSGEMLEVGFQLYADMLNAAVRALRKGQEPDLEAPLAVTTDINLHLPAMLPADYCPDVQVRLGFYKRLAGCQTADDIGAIQEELIDRYGKLPEGARALLELHRLRLQARPLGIVRIDAADTVIQLQFEPKPPIDPLRILQLVQKNRHIRLAGPERLRVEQSTHDLKTRSDAIRSLLRSLS